MNFYIKKGNDLFAPTVEAVNITLDNSVSTETTTFTTSEETPFAESLRDTGTLRRFTSETRTEESALLEGSLGVETIPTSTTTTTTVKTNGIIGTFKIKSKQNSLDNWITDAEYLQYTKINFIVFPSKDNLDDFTDRIQNKEFLDYDISEIITRINVSNIINSTGYTTYLKSISLNEIVNSEDLTISDYLFEAEYTSTFSDLSNTQDIILVVMPYIDFSSYFADNGIDAATITSILTRIYTPETYQYNILLNNETITDPISNRILNDVRQTKDLFETSFSAASLTIFNKIIKGQPQYLSDIFTSFDYENQKINNYVFFNIKKFLIDNSALPKLFDFSSQENINSILEANSNLNFTVINNNSELIIATGSINYGSNSSVGEITTNNTVCLFFTEDFPSTDQTKFNYTMQINYVDPFVKTYYSTTENTGSGIYYDTLGYLAQVKTYVDDPRNTDATTGKFINFTTSSALIEAKENLITNFFNLYNLFSNRSISNTKIEKISKSLDFNKATLFYYNEFLQYVEQSLWQIEKFFASFTLAKRTYTKNSEIIKFKRLPFYFAKNDENNKIKFFNEFDIVNGIADSIIEYDIETTPLDSTNLASYKLINSVINLSNNQISYSSEYSLLNNLLESSGITIEKNNSSETTNTRAKNLFSKSSTINDALQKPASSILDVKKQISKSKFDLSSTSISNIISKIEITNSLDYDTLLKFQLYFLNNINSDYLIPSIDTQIFNITKFKWVPISSVDLTVENYAYLARTIVKTKNTIFNKNKVEPPINNEYFILTDSPPLGANTKIEKFGNLSTLLNNRNFDISNFSTKQLTNTGTITRAEQTTEPVERFRDTGRFSTEALATDSINTSILNQNLATSSTTVKSSTSITNTNIVKSTKINKI